MTRLERNVNIAAVVLPFLVVAAAFPLLWGRLIGVSDVVVFTAGVSASGRRVACPRPRDRSAARGPALAERPHGLLPLCTLLPDDGSEFRR